MKETNIIVSVSHVNRDSDGRNVIPSLLEGKFEILARHNSYRVTAGELVRCLAGYDPVLRLRDGQTIRAYQGGSEGTDSLRVDAQCCIEAHDEYFESIPWRRS